MPNVDDITRAAAPLTAALQDWPVVTFGDVVKNVSETCREPEPEGLDRYLGLEHIDSENLHIKRWGLLAEDEVSFTRRFRAGQVLFGKRRAYLKKVGVAEFDGICSSDILCFEPKDPDVLLPGLLPFIVQSDGFFAHALGTSSGSLSPRTRWSQLKDYRFPLPPVDEQRRIAKLLWAADEVVERWREAETDIELLRESWCNTFLAKDWPMVSLGELLNELQYGSSKRSTKDTEGAVPILGIPNVIGGRILLDEYNHVKLDQGERDKYELHKGDVLIVRTNGNPEYVGRTAVVDQVPDGSVYASYLIRLRVAEDRLRPTYLHAALSSPFLRRTLRHEIRSSAGNFNLNTKGIKRQKISLPEIEQQIMFAEQFKQFISERDAIAAHRERATALKSELVNHHLRGTP